ncbi:hypothetical protein [Kineococcus esterisolvens]
MQRREGVEAVLAQHQARVPLGGLDDPRVAAATAQPVRQHSAGAHRGQQR